jgi:CheY-like chemotaxis protein
MLSSFLTKKWGCQCFLAKNGKEGLKVFENEKPNIALIDIEMPVMGEIEMAEKIRAISNVPILFMSGDIEGNFQNLKNFPLCSFMGKATSLEEYSKKIKALIAS